MAFIYVRELGTLKVTDSQFSIIATLKASNPEWMEFVVDNSTFTIRGDIVEKLKVVTIRTSAIISIE